MIKRRSLFNLFLASLRRRGKVDELSATDPGDADHAAAVKAMRAAIPGPINVVGNASSLLEGEYGAPINAHPTIRFNSAQIEKPEAQGSRWDIVATSNRNTIEYYNDHEPQFHTLLFTAYYDAYLHYLDAKTFDTPVLLYPMRWSIDLMTRLRARPTAGAQVLNALDQLGSQEVSIFGFDWKQTPTYYDAARKKDPHNHFGERTHFRKLIKDRGWQLYH